MFQNEQRITITARDLKVVSALQCDGRMTMQALADKIGISHADGWCLMTTMSAW